MKLVRWICTLVLILCFNTKADEIYGPQPTPWAFGWEVKYPELSPGLDYHINKYDDWRKDVESAYETAKKGIDAAKQNLPPGTLWCVVMDIDDTILDHSVFNRMIEETDQKFTDHLWRGWVESRNAVLVPQAKEFMEYINKQGGKVVLISNIKDYEEFPVRTRLFELGIRQGSHYTFVLPRILGSQSNKAERQQVIDELVRLSDKADDGTVEVRIFGSVGDQKTDEMANVPFYPIPQGSKEYGTYGEPAIGEKPPERRR